MDVCCNNVDVAAVVVVTLIVKGVCIETVAAVAITLLKCGRLQCSFGAKATDFSSFAVQLEFVIAAVFELANETAAVFFFSCGAKFIEAVISLFFVVPFFWQSSFVGCNKLADSLRILFDKFC